MHKHVLWQFGARHLLGKRGAETEEASCCSVVLTSTGGHSGLEVSTGTWGRLALGRLDGVHVWTPGFLGLDVLVARGRQWSVAAATSELFFFLAFGSVVLFLWGAGTDKEGTKQISINFRGFSFCKVYSLAVMNLESNN